MLKQRVQTTEPKLEYHKELPLHICTLFLSQSTLPLNQCSNATQKCSKEQKLLNMPGRLDRLHRAVRPPTPDLTAWGRLERPKRPALNQTTQNLPDQMEHLPNSPRCPKHAQTSPPCWQCMNQGKMRKVSTYSFSNIQNSSQGATQIQMSKLDTLQVRKDLNYMITKFHTHWTRLKRIWVILRKVTLS
jgi:hypothetical protein